MTRREALVSPLVVAALWQAARGWPVPRELPALIPAFHARPWRGGPDPYGELRHEIVERKLAPVLRLKHRGAA